MTHEQSFDRITAADLRDAMTMRCWHVMLDGQEIDKVFFSQACDADEIRRGLIEHDGYDPRITVEL